MTDKNVLLTLRSTEGDDLDRTRQALEELGLRIEKVLPISGVVAGRVESRKIGELLALDNVESVREERDYQLPPFDERVPQ